MSLGEASNPKDNLDEFLRLAEDYQPYVRKKKRAFQENSQPVEQNVPEKTPKPPEVIKPEPILDQEEESSENQIPETKPTRDYAEEYADVKIYHSSLKTSWKPPEYCKNMTEDHIKIIHKKFNIKTEGANIPYPLTSFKEMRIHKVLIKAMKRKAIIAPTPIQIQGLPVILSGRDLVGCSFTGSGKTLVYILPIITFALEQELELPFLPKEGPFALVLVPNRELGRQIYESFEYFCLALKEKHLPELKLHLCIGGIPIRDQIEELREGSHIVVATPGRLLDLVNKRVISLDMCRILCLDEADKLLDTSFENEFKKILSCMQYQHQTLLICSSIPENLSEISKFFLVKPVTIKIERGSATSLNVIQDVELISEDSKLLNIVRCIKKTPPPIIIFAYKKNDVQVITEYLTQKEIEVCALHSDYTPEERKKSIKAFLDGTIGIMVTTDMASKGLDFPIIKHVINYDIPTDINAYIHRIGRTGRGGRTGLSTTFVTKSCDESILLELRNLLVESKQRIPQFLLDLKIETAYISTKNLCPVCGSRGQHEPKCSKADRKTFTH